MQPFLKCFRDNNISRHRERQRTVQQTGQVCRTSDVDAGHKAAFLALFLQLFCKFEIVSEKKLTCVDSTPASNHREVAGRPARLQK